jgi:hypothetical protein
VQLLWKLYNREFGLKECEEWRALISRRFRAQEYDTDTTVAISALLWDLSFTIYVCVRYNSVLLAVLLYSEGYIYWIKITQTLFAKSGIANDYNSLQPNVQGKPPVNFTVLPSSAHYIPNSSSTTIIFICVHLYDWNWDGYGLLVMK